MNDSLTHSSYRIPIPRVFTSKQDNSTSRMNRTNELGQAIISKKKIIRTLISTNIGSCQYIKKTKRKPSVLLRFETGLKQYLFGKNGSMLEYFPNLRNQLIMEENKKKNKIFNTKIDAGELTYLNYKENELGFNQKMTCFKKKLLQKSHYFTIKKEHLDNINTKIVDNNKTVVHTINQSIQNIKMRLNSKQSAKTRNIAFAPNQKMLNFFKKNTNCNTNTETSTITNKEASTVNKIVDLNENNISSALSLSYYARRPTIQAKANTMIIKPEKEKEKDSLSPIRQNALDSYFQRKVIKKKILNKANILNQRQIKLEKKLFRIIDKSQIPESKFNQQNDIETIFETKAKKKKKKGQTKELYLKAVRIKNDYRCMESSKADLIKLSDTINNMTDDLALGLADRLIEEYWQKSVKAKVDLVQIPEIIKKKREKESKLLRNRISRNNERMIQMKNELIYEKNQLLNIIDERIQTKEIILNKTN